MFSPAYGDFSPYLVGEEAENASPERDSVAAASLPTGLRGQTLATGTKSRPFGRRIWLCIRSTATGIRTPVSGLRMGSCRIGHRILPKPSLWRMSLPVPGGKSMMRFPRTERRSPQGKRGAALSSPARWPAAGAATVDERGKAPVGDGVRRRHHEERYCEDHATVGAPAQKGDGDSRDPRRRHLAGEAERRRAGELGRAELPNALAAAKSAPLRGARADCRLTGDATRRFRPREARVKESR